MTINRRDFVRGQTAVVPAEVAIGALNTKFAWTRAEDFGDDIDVLNYALTLEYLEAEFYRQGNSAGLLSGKEKQYLDQVQVDEESHVATLRSTIMDLGGAPVAAPGVDFGASFDNREKFLTTAHVFENTGVSAYLGAAGYIKDKGLLQAAAGIFGVEARHAAIVGNLLGLEAEGGVYMGATETPLTKAKVLAAVAPFLTGPGSMSGDAATTL
jgi:predicted alpha-1,6-mannanase (GH76 family)